MRRLFRVELQRAFCTRRFWYVTVAVSILRLLAELFNYHIQPYLNGEGWAGMTGIVDNFQISLEFDTFMMVYVLILAGLCVGNFCKDYNSRYLRMILERTDVTSYTMARFLANIVAVTVSFLISTGVYIVFYRAIGVTMIAEQQQSEYLFNQMARVYPIGFMILMSVNFGLAASAFGAMGMAFSAYQPNAFISIGTSGMLFFLTISIGVWFGNDMLSMSEIIAMGAMPGLKSVGAAGLLINVAWNTGILLLLNAVSAYIFRRRLERRQADGEF